jgi:DNA-binding LacI/PurR family transcriptional regulator
VPVRIKDVANRAGVSSASVSRVLSNKPHISEEMRRRVLAAVQELGYKPSRVARSLRAKRARILGLIISDIQNPFFTSIVRAVEDVAYEQQYAVFLCNSDEDLDKENLYIELMRAERVAGVVLSPTRERDHPSRKLIEADIPVVAIDRCLLDLEVDTVMVDNVGAAFELVSHLISDGYRRVAAVLGDPIATTGHQRREGYERALKAHGLEVLPHLIRVGSPKEATGYQLTRELLGLNDRPEALFTGNNLLTVGALRAIREQGLSIPDDIALVAFDELDWMSLFDPGLTVVAQPTYQVGRTAAELILERIEDHTRPPQQVVFKPELIVRQSCAHHALQRKEVTAQSEALP